MSSASSLVTTAASDTSSSADSRYYSGGARRPNMEASSVPAVHWSAPQVQSSPVQSSRRRSYNLKARGVVIAKDTPTGGNQKVYCVCKVCKGQRMVSKSTCYRHLRVEAEIEEDDVKWDFARWGARSHEEALRIQSQHYSHFPSIPLGL